jgi:hypothetical protein
MSDRSAIKWFFGAAMTALVVGLLFAPGAQAKDTPINVTWAGSGHDLLHPLFGIPLFDNIVIADAKGSFGAESVAIVVRFDPFATPTKHFCDADETYFGITYGRAITTFKDGSQLYATVFPGEDSYMCLDEVFGDYEGSVVGVFIGGTGLFENASGPYVSPFKGQNLTSAAADEFPFRAITGSFEGVVTTP